MLRILQFLLRNFTVSSHLHPCLILFTLYTLVSSSSFSLSSSFSSRSRFLFFRLYNLFKLWQFNHISPLQCSMARVRVPQKSTNIKTAVLRSFFVCLILNVRPPDPKKVTQKRVQILKGVFLSILLSSVPIIPFSFFWIPISFAP